MCAQVGGHLSGILEKAWKYAPIGGDNRVLLIEDIKGRRSVVSVDHHLDAVAHVIDRMATQAVMGCIRIIVGGRKCIDNPRKASVGPDHDDRILLERKEGSQGCR